ncbi:MAG: sterol desaturase family protein [Imperialibacter sp.]|uniref:sterol desaturase family protein n=1 Tax=Imperialibacter sp. TaxID=2038411 RepID=UPI003A8C2831
MNLVYGTGLLFLLVLMELAAIRYFLQEKIPWKEIVMNLNSGHILLWIFRGLEVLAFHWLLTHFSFGWVAQWPVALQWVFAFVAWDFCFYWLHRLHHAVGFLWAVHVVHHEGEHFSLSLGIRNSWYSSLTSFPFFAGLAILGLPLEIFIVVSSVHYFIQFYNHNRIVKKSGWLEHIMITPSHHRVHHGKNPEYINKNCGGTFVIWDKLFGTFQAERDDIDIAFGTNDPVRSENPFWANNIPFLKWLHLPLPQLRKHEAQKSFFSDTFVGFGGLLLFCLLLFYIYKEPSWTGTPKLILFSIIFLGTIANGGLAENKLWGAVLWVACTNVFIVLFLLMLSINEPILTGLTIIIGLHGLETLRRLFILVKPKRMMSTAASKNPTNSAQLS